MYKILSFITFLIFSLLMVGCGGPGETNQSVNKNANGPATNNNTAGTTLNPTPKPVAPLENDAPTLGPVVRGYYEALKKKDDALLRTVVSQALIKENEDGMKEDKKTGSLAAYMATYDRLPEKDIEVRNEKINGDKGTAELKGGAYVNWSSISFIKEDGKWKMTNGGGEVEGMKPTNPPATTAK